MSAQNCSPSSEVPPIELHVRQNVAAHILDGGLYIGAMMFLAGTTVLPVLFEFLGAATWLIALAPQLSILGFLIPSIFVAHWVDRLHRVKPFTLWMGLFQRLPFVFVTVAIFMLDAEQHKSLLLVMVVGAILFSGLCGGFGMGAWQELIHRTVPARHRAGMFASRNALAAILGLFIGIAVEIILETYTGMQGYGILFACAAFGLFLSYWAFWHIREIPDDNKVHQERIGFWQNMRDLPAILKAEPGFILLIAVTVLTSSSMLVVPFLAIEARDRLMASDAIVGVFLTAQMIGGLIGNIFAGYLGNKWGGRLPYFVGSFLLLVTYVMIFSCQSQLGFQMVFALLGLGQFMMMVGQNTLSLELAPADRRTTALSILRVLTAPALVIASLCAAFMRDSGYTLNANVSCAFVLGVIALLLTLRIKEPRIT